MIALYIILFWVLVGVIGVTWFYYSHDMRMTSEATGSVVSAENREVHDKIHGRLDLTVVTCQFIVGGKPFEVVKTYRGRNAQNFPAGRKLHVRYNPADPTRARIGK